MENLVNKPKVFLSHAREDKPFIDRIAKDLRRCSIDYWLDTEEVRDGRSWLKTIFEGGIPTCDAVLVYLTKESLNSKMVEKELDAAVVQQLSEGGVRLLPYVSEAGLRGQLRSDIQALQCREWNDSNYEHILPTVVAEIWRSYLERTVEIAVLQEKTRRLELEIENRRLKEQDRASLFSASEEQEFQYLYKQLGRKIEITFDLHERTGHAKVGLEVCRVSILRILLSVIRGGGLFFDSNYLAFYVSGDLGEIVDTEQQELTREVFGTNIDAGTTANIQTEIHTYGLTRLTRIQQFDRWETIYEISDKMYRLKYWMEYNGLAEEPIESTVTLFPLGQPLHQSIQEETEKGRATAEALAADKKISEARRRKAWGTSGEGIAAADEELKAVFDDLKQRVSESNEVLKSIKLRFSSHPNTCSITSGEVTLWLRSTCPSQDITDYGLSLLIAVEKPTSLALHRMLFSCDFGIKVNDNLQIRWARKDSAHFDPYSSAKLADFCWSTFLREIQQNEDEIP
jgi:TIR domain